MEEEKRNPVDVLRGLMMADSEYGNSLRPQVDKILYLTEICREGVVGCEADWVKHHYERLTNGLATILEEAVIAFDSFEDFLKDEIKECRATPEFRKHIKETCSEDMIKNLEETGILPKEEA